MTVAEAQERIDARELVEWIAYYNLDPFGPERADMGSAIVACTVAAVAGSRRRVEDFMPDFERRPRRQSSTELHLRIMSFMQARKHG